MAFEGLSSRLQEITRKMRGKARITESDLKEMLREVKLALLEADVNYKIVKEFIATIQEKALGQDVLESLRLNIKIIGLKKDNKHRTKYIIDDNYNIIEVSKELRRWEKLLTTYNRDIYQIAMYSKNK